MPLRDVKEFQRAGPTPITIADILGIARPLEQRYWMEIPPCKVNRGERKMSRIEKGLEFPDFMEDSLVSERNLLEKWGTHRG